MALLEASATLTNTLEPPVVLASILHLSERLLVADAHAIWRLHAPSGRWQIASASGLSEPYKQAAIQILEQTPQMPQTPVVADDVFALPMLERRKEAYRAEGIRSMLVVPLRIHGRICGTLAVYHRRPHHFDAIEVRVATGVANLAAGLLGSADLYAEQARLHAEARAREEWLRVTLASIGDAVIATDIDGRATFLNPVAEGLIGWKRQEAEGQPLETIFRIINEQTRRPAENPVPRALREGTVIGLANHTVLIARDGSERPIADSASPIRNERGEITGVVLIFRDVTEAKKARAALEESEQQFRQLAEHITDVFWMATPSLSKILYASPAYETIWGRSRRSLYEDPHSFLEAIHPEDRQRAMAKMDRQARGESTAEEYRVVRPDGSVRWIWDRAFQVRDADGQVYRVAGIAEDVTGRKRAEQDARFLADASATLAAVVDYESTLQKVARLAVPFFADWCTVDMLDEGGTLRRLAVAHVDPSKVELAHELHRRYPPDPSEPRGTWDIIRTGRSKLVEISDDLLAATVTEADFLRILRELGLRSYMGVPLAVRDRILGVITFIAAESGRRYEAADLVVAEDLAHRAAVAIENARLYQAVREADRRKDEFLALLGHELRNPLAPICNALQLLKMPGADGAVADKAREMMVRQVEHLVRLVDDLLDVSRIMRGKVELRREPLEVATVVARAVETSQPVLDAERHELTVSLPPGPMWVNGDLVRLAQVVSNLLNNAAKYTESGGQISLTASAEENEAVLRVRDTGIGISPEQLPRLFDMFFQGQRRTKDG
jgi:PAS domain S-box-containing protein